MRVRVLPAEKGEGFGRELQMAGPALAEPPGRYRKQANGVCASLRAMNDDSIVRRARGAAGRGGARRRPGSARHAHVLVTPDIKAQWDSERDTPCGPVLLGRIPSCFRNDHVVLGLTREWKITLSVVGGRDGWVWVISKACVHVRLRGVARGGEGVPERAILDWNLYWNLKSQR